MTALRQMKAHVRRFGLLHAGWIIAILCGIIVAIVLGQIDSHKIGDYVSVMASAISIILALTAIFYAFVSNQDFSQSVGRLGASTANLESAAGTLAGISEALDRKVDGIAGEVARVPKAVDDLTKKIETSVLKTPKSSLSGPKSNTEEFFDDLPFGLQLSFYICALSLSTRRPILVNRIFVDDTWSNIVFGTLVSIQEFKIKNVMIDDILVEKEPGFVTSSMEALDADAIITAFEGTKPEAIMIEPNSDVRKYFGRPALQSEEKKPE